ncbi:hypothetical protein CRYUN_Cryun30bG0080600 [Craigia yunnanensis]
MNNYPFGSNSPKSFNAYPRGDFDIESGTIKRTRRSRNSPFYPVRMIKSLANRLHYYYKLHPLLVFFISLSFGVTILIVLSLYEHHYRMLNAGPRSEAQSYWTVAESKGWFGKEESVKWRALTEEHARDSFENLLFSVCRFRELTGTYPHNITVVSYDFKEERFAHLHRSAIGFPESQFFYTGTPASPTSKEAALKGEALVRTQFQQDPYGCIGSLKRKKVGRDPFHRSIPYPNGCPEIEGLFRYCEAAPYRGSLPWAE